MSDFADEASKLSGIHLETTLNSIPRYEGESARECSRCGNTIPEGRRDALPGITTCVECAE